MDVNIDRVRLMILRFLSEPAPLMHFKGNHTSVRKSKSLETPRLQISSTVIRMNGKMPGNPLDARAF